MATAEELYKQSRTIRRLIKQGKTLEEIATKLSLTKTQIKYRINTKYGTKATQRIWEELMVNQSSKKAGAENNKRKSKGYCSRYLLFEVKMTPMGTCMVSKFKTVLF